MLPEGLQSSLLSSCKPLPGHEMHSGVSQRQGMGSRNPEVADRSTEDCLANSTILWCEGREAYFLPDFYFLKMFLKQTPVSAVIDNHG